MAYATGPRRALRVRGIADVAHRIRTFELVDPAGGELPEFTAGAHVDVEVPGGLLRQYSLCSDPSDRSRYEIAVLHEPDGRGGSHAMHTLVQSGDILPVSPPRNTFPLHKEARHHQLLAGGVGITPIMAMVEELGAAGAEFSVVYCTRTNDETAFADRLAHRAPGRVRVHHDHGDPERSLDLAGLLADPVDGKHLYCCGPPGMLAAVADATQHWPADHVHVERFVADPPIASTNGESGAFEIELARTSMILTVPSDRTIVDVLRDAGVPCDTSCEAGICATCRTRYLDGSPDHQDLILDDAEREEYMTICCSRSETPRLVLDI